MSTPEAVRAAVAALLSALLALLLVAGSAAAATDHVVITGGGVVPAGQTAGDVIVLDGGVRIAGHATGDVVSVSGPIRVAGRVDGDVIAVSDRAFLARSARVGGDLRYGDERPVIARGARVAGQVSKEDWADAGSGWGWVSVFAWWLAVSVSTLIVGALLVWLAPGALHAAERAVREHLGATIGWGVAIAIGVPLLAILALVTLVGIPFGIALLLAAIPVLLVAYASRRGRVRRRGRRAPARIGSARRRDKQRGRIHGGSERAASRGRRGRDVGSRADGLAGGRRPPHWGIACAGRAPDPAQGGGRNAGGPISRAGHVRSNSQGAERRCRRTGEERRAGLEGAKRRSAAIGSASKCTNVGLHESPLAGPLGD